MKSTDYMEHSAFLVVDQPVQEDRPDRRQLSPHPLFVADEQSVLHFRRYQKNRGITSYVVIRDVQAVPIFMPSGDDMEESLSPIDFSSILFVVSVQQGEISCPCLSAGIVPEDTSVDEELQRRMEEVCSDMYQCTHQRYTESPV